MNDDPEDEEDDATTDILIGEGDDWPEDYSEGFDAPMKVIGEILSSGKAAAAEQCWRDYQAKKQNR